MSANRSSRVQGSWASGPRRNKNSSSRPSTSSQFSSNFSRRQRNEFTNKPFVFEATKLDQKVVPKELLIESRGKHVISESSKGQSVLVYEPNYLSKSDSDWMFQTLLNELPWKRQKCMTPSGEVYFEPRRTSWFSDYGYTYSRTSHVANPNWHPLLTALLDQLNGEYPELKFNSVLANLYDDGHCSVGWHSDDEPALGVSPPIASVSFGDTRSFELREKPEDLNHPDGFTYTRKVKVNLHQGSLLLMLGSTQEDWQHRVPREYHDRNPRINLTFRRMFPNTN